MGEPRVMPPAQPDPGLHADVYMRLAVVVFLDGFLWVRLVLEGAVVAAVLVVLAAAAADDLRP